MSRRELRTVIRRAREQKGMTQRYLAEKAKVTAAYVAQLEMGVKTNPSLDVLKRLAKALGMPLTDLLT
jgi:transcriptional regulator with XRE-family HTH domain